MKTIVRGVLSVLAGFVAACVLMIGLESAGHLIYPPPASLAEVARMPAWVFALILAIWAVSTLFGAWLASRIAPGRGRWAGMVVGLVLLAAGVVNMAMIPHPAWVWVVGLGEFLPLAYIGTRLASAKPRLAS